MKKTIAHILILSILLFTVAACGKGDSSTAVDEAALKQTEMAAYVQQTVIAVQIQTEVAKSMIQEDAAVEPTIAPTFTPEFTLAPEFTSTPVNPTISVTMDTNCRSGPGEEYNRLGFLFTGAKGLIIGWDGIGDYYLIKNPQGGKDCWVWAKYAVLEGNTSNLAVMQAPPSPTPNRLWEHTWTMKFEGETYSVRISQSGYNISATVELENGRELRITGETNTNQTHVKGTYKISSSRKGTFKWVIDDNYNQFRGESVNEKDKTFGWCGSWNGKPLPSPCELQ